MRVQTASEHEGCRASAKARREISQLCNRLCVGDYSPLGLMVVFILFSFVPRNQRLRPAYPRFSGELLLYVAETQDLLNAV